MLGMFGLVCDTNVSCGDAGASCNPHASCVRRACACNEGYSGDGLSCAAATDACADGPCLEAAAAEFAAKLVAAAADPSTPIIAVVSEITFDGDVLLVAEGTGARAEFELGFAAAMASSLGDGELGHSRARGTLLR
jgi:hypothetical protein